MKPRSLTTTVPIQKKEETVISSKKVVETEKESPFKQPNVIEAPKKLEVNPLFSGQKK